MGGVNAKVHDAAVADAEAKIADKLGEHKLFAKRLEGQRATIADKHGKLRGEYFP